MNKLVKKVIAVTALGMAVAPCSYAARPAAENDFHFALALGLTEGGDSLATAEYTNGDSATIRGGGLIQVGAGVWYHKPSVPLSALLSINYHFDQANARNGDIRFDRWPLELVGYYHLNDSWRIGVGIRHVMNPKLTIDIKHQAPTEVDYRDTDSPIFEVGWGPNWRWNRNNFWVGLRYVHETLKAERITTDYQTLDTVDHSDDGSNIGVFVHYAF